MTIKILKKMELSSVVFIRDYLQFVFEDVRQDVRLSAFTLPIAIVNGMEYKVGSERWRDALCSLINKVVIEAFAEEGESISITFEEGDKLEISLREEDYDGPEAAMLSEDGQIIVW